MKADLSPIHTVEFHCDSVSGSVTLPLPDRTTRVDRPAGSGTGLGVRDWLTQLGERLGPHEWRRRMVHFAPGLLPFILAPIPHRDPMSPTLRNVVLFTATWVTALAWFKRSTYMRNGERGMLGAVFGYSFIVVGLLLLFPIAPELGLAVMGIIAFGDGSATLAGLLVRGRRLPWNPAKSWAGLTAFVAASIPLATLIYWGEAQPGVPLATALACVAPAAFVAALAESLPSRINDNIRVGLAAAMTILPAHVMFVGW